MARPRARSFPGISAIIISFLSLSILILAKEYHALAPYREEILIAFSLSILSSTIIFGWVWAGVFGGTVFFAAAVVVLLVVERHVTPASGAQGLIYVLSWMLGSRWRSKLADIDQKFTIRKERTAEESNVATDATTRIESNILSLQGKLAKYATLKDVTEALGTDLSMEDITGIIVDRSLNTISPLSRALLFLVDPKKQELMLTVSRNSSKIKTKKGDVFDLWVFRNRKSLVVEDVSKDFRFSADDIEDAREHYKSLIVTPLVSAGKVVGILRIDSMRESSFTHDDLRILDVIASIGAIALENAQLYARTQELAIKDGLTGLAVRRYLMERFDEELKRSSRKRNPLSLVILDIDHFKAINDQFGHTAGDLVLKHLARVLGTFAKEDDIVGRYGGDELALVMVGSDKAKAARVADELRALIENEPLTLRRHKAYVAVSIGVAAYPDDAIDRDELIKIADERLYKAKNAGRNKVVSA